MTQPLASRAAPLRVAAVTVLLALASCAKTEKTTSDSTKNTAAAPAADSSVRALAAAAPMRAEPGNLPKPIDQMTGEELYSFTRTLSFGGGVERRRRCRGNPECRGNRPKDSTVVRVDAVEREDSLSMNGLSPNGVIGARALNRGTLADSMYNTRPGQQYEYYLIVTSAGPGVASWRLEELDTTKGARAHRSVSTGAFHGCNHPFVPGTRAAFKTCAQAAADVKPAALGMFQTDEESPIWVSCAYGCCTADYPDGRG